MTVLAYNSPPNTTIVYGVLEFSLTSPVVREVSLTDLIILDAVEKLGTGNNPLSCYVGLYLQSSPSVPPTRYQSAAAKYNLGQFNLELGGYVIYEGFLNYLNQQLANIYIPINRSTYTPYGDSVYTQPAPGAIEELEYYAPYEISLQNLPNTRIADSVFLNLTYSGTATLLAYYYLYGTSYAYDSDLYVCVL